MSLTVLRVSHRFGSGPLVLDHVSFQAESGGSIAIVGPSGSGKTTLLSIVGQLIEPTSGSVAIDDAPIPSSKRVETFSWVFQTTGLLSRRTVADNVVIGRLQHGHRRSSSAESVRAVLKAVELGGYVDKLAYQLSGGEAQRVGIARAVISGVPWILADEPTGQLDRSTSAIVGEVLVTNRPRSVGVVVATHDNALAQRCDVVLALDDGRLSRVA
jgi:putative ABC transport system ATP-binding protein/lipoprotein-releasing system ATP-binding protein